MKKKTATTPEAIPPAIAELNGLKVTKAAIYISANRHIKSGYFVNPQIDGVLPRGRKVQRMTYSVYRNRVHLQPLYGYANGVDVDPEQYRTFLRSLPVVSDTLFPVKVTAELEAFARAEAESICHCPAVTGEGGF